jgi:hypothetical protein
MRWTPSGAQLAERPVDILVDTAGTIRRAPAAPAIIKIVEER